MALTSARPGRRDIDYSPSITPMTPVRNNNRSVHSDLLRNPRYTDLAIWCHGRSWQVHRSIVCVRSKFFEAQCGDKFRNTRSRASLDDTQISDCREIALDDENPDVVDMLLSYIYEQERPNFVKSIQAYHAILAGEKFQVAGLKEYGIEYFLRRIRSALQSFKRMDGEDQESWVDWLCLFYKTEIHGLDAIRTAMVAHLARHGTQLLTWKKAKDLLAENETFRLALINRMSAKITELEHLQPVSDAVEDVPRDPAAVINSYMIGGNMIEFHSR